MLLTFLAAADLTPLAKRFVQSTETLEVHPYPQVRDFISFTRTATSLEDALVHLQVHAAEGHCLLKGALDRPLVSESRAGHTNPLASTHYLLLDLDFDRGFSDIDHFMSAIGLEGASYILHHSSSSGIRAKTGLRAHILVPLAQPANPSVLKEWLKHLNLSVPELRQQITLSANKMSLVWPLDITTCQNDKIIYIADPVVDGLVDPMAGSRFELCERAKSHATVDLTGLDPEVNRQRTEAAIDTLREHLGLPKAKPRYRATPDGQQLLLNPAAAIVTGERQRRNFVYLNLNGGDSWAYYYPKDNPEIVHNFKGEPAVRLADIAPDYYAQVKPRDPIDVVQQGTERFVLRDNSTDTYYTAIYDMATQHVELSPAQRKHLSDFLAMTDQPMPESVPEWTLEFNPTTLETFDRKRHWINLYRPPAPMLERGHPPEEIPPTIQRILKSICVTAEVQAHFINWLAFVFQTRKKPKTAFIFHGVEGTGKGLLYKEILRPLFGPDYCLLTTVNAIKDGFNDWAAKKIFLCLDEMKVQDNDGDKVPELLRNYISEDFVDIRGMRRNRVQLRNYLSVLVFTNLPDPMKIPASDRRYTVAPRQGHKLIISQAEIDAIAGEVQPFADYLQAYNVDEPAVRTPMETDAKEAMRIAAEGTGERILRAISAGDLQFFANLLDSEQPVLPDPQGLRYSSLVRAWVEGPNPVHISRDDVRNVYQHLTGGRITKVGLNRLLGTRMGWPTSSTGYYIHFTPLTSRHPALDAIPSGNVTPFRSAS